MSQIRLSLKGAEMSGDGKSVVVTVAVQQLRTHESFFLNFIVKREGSLDLAVKEAERQLRDFAQDFYQAASIENPLLRSITSH
jgi:hypothetical protein